MESDEPTLVAGSRAARRAKAQATLGLHDFLGEGDTSLVLDFLPNDLADIAFEKLKNEVQWNVMHHRGGEVPRLVAVEGEIDADGSFPVYRHPADSSPPLCPWSPTVSLIRTHVSRALTQPINHVLIQHYRSGADYISEHADKTVDVVRGSAIANVSLGAQRTMVLRRKRDAKGQGESRDAQRIPLLHNSLFVLGPETNRRWLHGIPHDKRPLVHKAPAEQVEQGERISLTFRHVVTFLTRDEQRIWGQGARAKTKDEARPVVRGGEGAEALLLAFGKENTRSNFDWEEVYGDGFDVLHFTNAGTAADGQSNVALPTST